MALQYARRMGFRVVAVGRGNDISAEARALGAHHYIDNEAEDVVAQLRGLGGAQAIVATIGHATTVSVPMGAVVP